MSEIVIVREALEGLCARLIEQDDMHQFLARGDFDSYLRPTKRFGANCWCARATPS